MAACSSLGVSGSGDFTNLQHFQSIGQYQDAQQAFCGSVNTRSHWHNSDALQTKSVGLPWTNVSRCDLPTLLRSRCHNLAPGAILAHGFGANKVLDSSGLSTRPVPPPGLEVPTKTVAAGTDNSTDQLAFYESLIKSCTRTGDVSRAEEHLLAMREANIQPTVEAINAMIHVCTQCDRMETAEQYIEFMEKSGVGSNVVSYNSVINACACRGDLQRSAFWFDKMITRGLRPNEITFGTLCKALARHGEAEKIERLMAVLEVSGTHLNEYFYASLISACMQSQPVDLERAERALRDMISRNFSARRVRGPLTRSLGKEAATELLGRVLKSSKSTEQGLAATWGQGSSEEEIKGSSDSATETLSQPVLLSTGETCDVNFCVSPRYVQEATSGSRRNKGEVREVATHCRRDRPVGAVAVRKRVTDCASLGAGYHQRNRRFDSI